MKRQGLICLLVCLLVVVCSAAVSAKFVEKWVGSFTQMLQYHGSMEAQMNFQIWALQNGYVVDPMGLLGGQRTLFNVNGSKTGGDLGTLDMQSDIDFVSVKWVPDLSPDSIGFMTIIQGIPVRIHPESTPEEYYDRIRNILSFIVHGTEEYLTEMAVTIFCDTDPFVFTGITEP